MQHIGKVIKECRLNLKLSQKELAEGICSLKYVYLVEKGDRTPSVYLMKLLGDRLGVDLFGIAGFLDCKNPLEMHETMKLFDLYKRRGDYGRLRQLTELKMAAEVFKSDPWKSEIELNQWLCSIFIDGNIKETIMRAENAAESFCKQGCTDINHINRMILLSTAYQMNGELGKAQKAAEAALKRINNKVNIPQYMNTVVSANVTYIFILLQEGRYDDVLREGTELYGYQMDNGLYDKIILTYCALALAHCHLGELEKAQQFGLKVIYISLINFRAYDIRQMLKARTFLELIQSVPIDCETKKQFFDLYDIEQDSL